jgi:hypothetical protein
MSSSELVQAGEPSISCYVNEIPPFIEAELVNAYETLDSSLPFFKVFRSLEQVNCYVARRTGLPSTVLLFTCRDRRVEVLNEMIEIDQAEVQRFAAYAFAKFEQADIIRFKALKTTTHKFGFPVQQHESKDTYVISLPATPDKYTESLGKHTRADIRQKTNKVRREFPGFVSTFYVDEEIDEKHVREILALSEHKINAKGVKLAHDVERVIALAKMCGFVNVLTIDGRICAGSVNYRIGTTYVGGITGYDPAYEKYGLGRVCVHESIRESIARGGKKYYLGGGAFEFKQRLLGVPLCMDELHIYRSRAKMLLNLGRAARIVMLGRVRYLKKTLHQNNQKAWAKFVFKSFHFVRNRLAK